MILQNIRVVIISYEQREASTYLLQAHFNIYFHKAHHFHLDLMYYIIYFHRAALQSSFSPHTRTHTLPPINYNYSHTFPAVTRLLLDTRVQIRRTGGSGSGGPGGSPDRPRPRRRPSGLSGGLQAVVQLQESLRSCFVCVAYEP